MLEGEVVKKNNEMTGITCLVENPSAESIGYFITETTISLFSFVPQSRCHELQNSTCLRLRGRVRVFSLRMFCETRMDIADTIFVYLNPRGWS